jgi:hypothetical protein
MNSSVSFDQVIHAITDFLKEHTGPIPLLMFVIAAVLILWWVYIVIRGWLPSYLLSAAIIFFIALGFLLNDYRDVPLGTYISLNLRMTDAQTIRSDCEQLIRRWETIRGSERLLRAKDKEFPSSFARLGAEAAEVYEGKVVTIYLYFNPIGSHWGIAYDPKKIIDPTAPRVFKAMWYRDFYWFRSNH